MKVPWASMTSGIIEADKEITIPYPPPKPPQLPLAEEVLISEALMIPKEVRLMLSCNKWPGLTGDTFQEFAVFLCNDITTWLGKEVGFRLPLDTIDISAYMQQPFNKLWFEKYETVMGLATPHTYCIFLDKIFWNLYAVSFWVDLKLFYKKPMWLPKGKMWLVAISHNWDEHLNVQSMWLKIHDVEVFY